jgi:DNA polymerase-3 subunit epsilon
VFFNLGGGIINFVAIDFETANADRSSVCSMGIVVVESGEVVHKTSWLIRPSELYFDPYNTYIHGIAEDDVKDKPEFNEIWDTIKPYIEGKTLIAHNAGFDMSVLRYVLNEYEIPYPEFEYSCTRILSKKTWPGLISYKLDLVAEHLGIEFKHHDAEQDALACAHIALKSFEISGLNSIQELNNHHAVRTGRFFLDGYRPSEVIFPNVKPSELMPNSTEFDKTHSFYNKHVVFTGTLQSMVRKDAMQKVVDLGGSCTNGVTKESNFLVLGDQDFTKLKDGKMSSKMKKAEDLVNKGLDIEIISEDEFLRLI